MICTEKEAKKKYYPKGFKMWCVGSGCMWWEWSMVSKFAPSDDQEKEPTGQCGGKNASMERSTD